MTRAGMASGLLAVLLCVPALAHAEDDDGEAREAKRSGERPFEVGLTFLGGMPAVGRSTFHASGVNGASIDASGQDLGYVRPLAFGLGGYGLYFPTRDLALGFFGSGTFTWGGASGSAAATAGQPGTLSMIDVGPDAELVLVHGRTSLRVGAALGLRAASVDLHAPDFEKSNGRPGSAFAADFFVWPHVTLMQRFDRYGEAGMFTGIELASAEWGAPAWNAGLVLALR